jgi:hypothetical protein
MSLLWYRYVFVQQDERQSAFEVVVSMPLSNEGWRSFFFLGLFYQKVMMMMITFGESSKP